MNGRGARPFESSPAARLGWLALALYLLWATSTLEFNPARFISGLDNGARFIHRMFPSAGTCWSRA